MADDLALRLNPQYAHCFEDKPSAPKVDVRWLPPITTKEGMVLRNSVDGRFQVRKHGDPAVYDLYNVRVVPFARPIKLGLTSFEDVRLLCQRSE